MGWNKKATKLFVLVALVLVIVSCTVSYKFNGSSINYNLVKTITIETFPIQSEYVYAPLGTTFNEQLQDIFIRQTRLQLVPRNGDLVISGAIVSYRQINQAVKADGYSSETQLRIEVKVNFVNNTNHSQDFEQTFSAQQNYDSSLPLSSVQDELISKMVKDITEQIFNATVANW